jgi:hypothetical protein
MPEPIQGARFAAYFDLMVHTKTVSNEVVQLKESNHAGWFTGQEKVFHPTIQNPIDLEVRERRDRKKFAFYIKAEIIHESPCFRFDSAGISHNNRYSDVPLIDRVVSTPHFAKFDNFGRWLAYKTEKLKDANFSTELSSKIAPGLAHFCEEAQIQHTQGRAISLVQEQDLIPVLETDPHSGVTFP